MTAGAARSGSPPVLVCRSCGGMTFRLTACRCTSGGGRLLVEDGDVRGAEPYRDCQVCAGIGTVARPCHDCRQTGRRRAQLVLTVANLDTGAVASANVVPGVVRPARWPGNGASWHLPLGPLLGELAATVGAATWTSVRDPRDSANGPLVILPPNWRPDLPAPRRELLEAEAIATHAHDAWRLYLGRTTALPAPDPSRHLGRLCRLADLLRLDLVVEARRQYAGADLTWQVRYEVPGGPVPPEARGADDLVAAITDTTVLDALYDLEERGRTAPAHYLTGDHPPAPEPPVIDLDQLDRRIRADCADLGTGAARPGAQAVWRDGRWWHTSLRVAGNEEIRTEWNTGQVYRRERMILRRGWEPPAPSWQGEPVPYAECPDCDPRSRLRRCQCRRGDGPADPDCPACAGAGRSPSPLRCDTCRGTGRRHRDLTITLTDLADRVVHLSWRTDGSGWQVGVTRWPTDDPGQQVGGDSGRRVGDGPGHRMGERGERTGEQVWWTGERVPAAHVGTHPGGKPLLQLPAQFRLAGWAAHFGVRPADLTELDGGGDLDHDLLNGTVTRHDPGADPLLAYLSTAARGRPGARLFVLARRPDVPPLADVIRLVLGLRLAVTVSLIDHVRNAGDLRLVQGERWEVRVVRPGSPVIPADPPTRATPEAAIASCLEFLELAIARGVPEDPAEPIPVPQSATPITLADPVPLIRRLARHHAGSTVAVHYAGAGCQVWLRDRDGVRRLGGAPTLPAVLDALGC